MQGEPRFPEMTEKGSPYRRMTYSESFKELVTENPGLIASFKKIQEKIRKKAESEDPEELQIGDVFEENGLKVALIDPDEGMPKYGVPGDYLKVEIGEKAFFVKTVNGFDGQSTGVQEIHSLERVREILKGRNDVDVVDFQFGYQEKDGTTYFVSTWEEATPLPKYLKILKERTEKEDEDANSAWNECAKIRRNIEGIKGALVEKFKDVSDINFLYNPKTEKFIVFDIHHPLEIGNEFSAKRPRKGQ